VLRSSQIRHLLRVTEATSRHPERDALILLLGITCGMRVTEIARVEVADVLTLSGAIRAEVSLRAVITKGVLFIGVADKDGAITGVANFDGIQQRVREGYRGLLSADSQL